MLTKSKKYIMHRGMLSLIFAFALSVSAILSPLVRAEESPRYTWKDIVIPGDDRLQDVSISRDGSKYLPYVEIMELIKPSFLCLQMMG